MLVCHNCQFLNLSDKLRRHRFFQSRAENPFPALWCKNSLLCSLSVLQSVSTRAGGVVSVQILLVPWVEGRSIFCGRTSSSHPPLNPQRLHWPLSGQFCTVFGYCEIPESFSDVFLPRAKTLFLWLGATVFITREMIIFDYLNICSLSGTSSPS